MFYSVALRQADYESHLITRIFYDFRMKWNEMKAVNIFIIDWCESGHNYFRLIMIKLVTWSLVQFCPRWWGWVADKAVDLHSHRTFSFQMVTLRVSLRCSPSALPLARASAECAASAQSSNVCTDHNVLAAWARRTLNWFPSGLQSAVSPLALHLIVSSWVTQRRETSERAGATTHPCLSQGSGCWPPVVAYASVPSGTCHRMWHTSGGSQTWV